MKAVMMLALMLMLGGSAWSAESVIVTQAMKYIGQGETCGDNCGKFVQRVLDDDRRLPWCAAFVSYVLQETEAYDNMPYILRARNFLKYGRKVSKPKPGDIVVWARGKDMGHVGIVKSVGHGYFYALEGNTGAYPSKVMVIRHKVGEKALLGFRRL